MKKDPTILFFLTIFVVVLLPPIFAQEITIHISIPMEGTSEFCGKYHTCFIPIEVLTQVGAQVIWTNDDLSTSHTVTSGDVVVGPDGRFDSGTLGPHQSFSFVFEEVGIFPYYCTIHPWKEGVVKVQSEQTQPLNPTQSKVESSSEIEKLRQENDELKKKIIQLEEEIKKLNLLVREQLKVIFTWISSR